MPLMAPWQQQNGVEAPQAQGVAAPSPQGAAAGFTPAQLQAMAEMLHLGDRSEALASKQAALNKSKGGSSGNPFFDIGANFSNALEQDELDDSRHAQSNMARWARKDYLDNLNKMPQPDVTSLLYADEKDAPVKAQALAAALRQREQLASAAMGSGDPRLAEMAKQLLGSSKEAEGLLANNAEHYQANRFTRERDTANQAHDTEKTHYNQGQENFRQGRALAQGKYSLSAPTPTSPGYVVDTRTGEATPLLDAAPGKPGAAGKDAVDMDKALKALKEDLDPSRGRNGAFGLDLALGTSAQKVKALVKNPETGEVNYNLTVGQVPEFIQNVAGMLSNGGHAAQGTIEHLYPHTAGMSVAKKLEWITGHPEVANVPDFVKQFYETAEREDHLAQERMRNVKLDRLSAHQGHFKLYPEEFKATARQYLKDMSDEDLGNAFVGKYDRSGKPKAAPTGLSADEAAEFEALHKKYGGAK